MSLTEEESYPNDEPEPTGEVGKGSFRTSPGVLHTGSIAMGPTLQPELGQQFDKSENTSKDCYTAEEESYQDDQLSTLEVDRPNLSTIQEETSVLLEDTPTRNTLDDRVEVNMEPEESLSTTNSTTDTANESDHILNTSDDTSILSEEFIAGPLKVFMDIEQTLTIMKGPYTALERIPLGRKDGMYYVLDNTENIEKRKKGQRSDFWDDCGTWTKASTPNTVYLYRNDKLTSIRTKQGQYCVLRQVKNKSGYIPIEPQPNEEEVITVRRLYQTLKATSEEKEQFKRRVTWIEKNRSVNARDI